ncbi:MAG: YceD family protein [Nitrospiraceae bacterium]
MALPSFHLTEIPDEGLSLTCEVQLDELGLMSEEAQALGALSVSLSIVMMGRRIDVNGVIDGTFRRQCVRCLKGYDEAAEVPFAVQYECEPPAKRYTKPVVTEPRKTTDDVELDESGADEDVYRCAGDRLELGEMLREHIILSIPIQPLCREDCLGLCPVCGQDRNEAMCECIEESRRNPFTALRLFKKH